MDEEPTSDIDTDAEGAERDGERGGFGSLGSIVFLLALTWAAGIASFPLNDNSFFTHLATGRIILDEGRVPNADPYTFTAAGEPWTVQSWLASVIYAAAERTAGGFGVKGVILIAMLAAVSLLWLNSRAASSLVPRLGLVSLGLMTAAGTWSERPLMIAVIGMAVVWAALEGLVRPLLLVPLLWFWANTHGSYPLAVALCILVLIGEAADQRFSRRPGVGLSTEIQVLGAVVAGILLGVVGPLGFRVLTFPFTALDRAETFGEVKEWQPPQFDSPAELAFLVLVVVTIGSLARVGRWRMVLPAAAFIAASVLAQRNIALAVMILVPVAAAGVPRVGSLRSTTRPALGGAMAVVAMLLFIATSAVAILRVNPVLELYPQRPLAWLGEDSTHQHRIAYEELTGNLLEGLDGAEGVVFFDDRFDMFPQRVADDYLALSRGRPDWAEVLDRYEIDTVVWSRSQPLGSLTAVSPAWRVVFSDSEWLVACRRGTDCPGS